MTRSQDSGKELPQWQQDLDQIGVVRRLLLARKWYGTDWWFVFISGILLLFTFIVAFFPGLFAPYDPRAEVGPSLLSPGEFPPSFVLVGKTGGILSVDDLVEDEIRIGIVKGSPSSQVLRDVVRARQEELRAAGSSIVLRSRNERFDTIAEAIDALAKGDVAAVAGLLTEVEPLLEGHRDLQIGETLSGKIQKSFTLGTNQIGQDILSRIIWGTRIALLLLSRQLYSL
jgi:ABC-type dipeptide/oligopeptide/nickel transport system permease subunit